MFGMAGPRFPFLGERIKLRETKMTQMGRSFQVMRFSKSIVIYLGSFAVLLVSCEKNSEIKVYRVSKAPLEESAPVQENAMPTNAASPGAQAGMAPVTSTNVSTPPNWEPQPLSQMRQASFLVKGENGAAADISLVSLGAAAGNVLDNVNRWLEQLGQPPITAEKLAEIVERLTTPIGEVTIVDLVGLPKDADPARDGRIVAAIAPGSTSALFFKMRGNADLAEAQKADFIKWVAAVCTAQAENKSSPRAANPVAPRDSKVPQVKWKTPEGWTEVPPSSMRYASFSVSGEDDTKIDISIVTFPGEGGSIADNVNRWRGQIGLAPLNDKEIMRVIVPMNAGSANFSTVEMAGVDSRVIAAWTRRTGRSWFFKMSGPGPLVEREKSKFFDFLRSIEFSS
jgi:hypothetical protein